MGSGGGAPERNLYAETAGELKAKADLAPKVYATEAEFRPQYNALDLRSIDQLLNGVPGGEEQLEYTEMVRKYRNPETGALSDTPGTSYERRADGRIIASSARPWEEVQTPVLRTRTVPRAATPGYLDIADRVADRASAIEARGLSTQRAADIQDVADLGGKSLSAVQQSDPRTAALIEALTSEASDELGLGYDMSPEQMRLAQQTIRARNSGTLGAVGPSGDVREAIGVSKFAQDLRDKRRQFAAGTVGLRSAVYGDAFNRVLARPAAASPTSSLNTAYGISSAAGPRMFGSTVNANEVFSDNQNAAAANDAARRAQNQTYAGAGIGAGAAVLAALI